MTDQNSTHYAKQINREAGYVILTSFLTLAAIALLTFILVGRYVIFIFSFVYAPAFFLLPLLGEHNFAPVDDMSAYSAILFGLVVFSIWRGWRRAASNGLPTAFVLAINVVFVGIATTLILGLMIWVPVVFSSYFQASALVHLGFRDAMWSVGILCVLGPVLTMPVALVCAYVYLKLARPLLLRYGLVAKLLLSSVAITANDGDAAWPR